jgi:hypothetical protein
LTEDKIKDDFFDACDMTADLLIEFDRLGLERGPALGGALTQILSYLMAVSPDKTSAMTMLSSCLSNAAINHDERQQTHESNELLH